MGDGGVAEAAKLRERLYKEIEMFGIWDARRSAAQLGFQFGTDSSQDNDPLGLAAIAEEDAFLDDLLAENARECLTLYYVYVTTLKTWIHPLTDLDVTPANLEDADFTADIAGDDAPQDDLKTDPSSDTFPYPNYPVREDIECLTFLNGTDLQHHQMFLMDTLDHLLRIPISDALMRMFLYVLRECGVRGVLSFDGFRKMQADVREKCSGRTMPCRSERGNMFWMVDPRKVIAQVLLFLLFLFTGRLMICYKDWMNPAVRPHIHVYPEIPDGPIVEVWHTDKWHFGLDTSMLSPMFDAGDRHYYVNEVAQLQSGKLVIPIRWVIKVESTLCFAKLLGY